MKKYLTLVAVAALMLATSCVNEVMDPDSQESGLVQRVFTAFQESNSPTKAFVSGTDVYWNPGDGISLFEVGSSVSRGGTKFVTDITEPSATATFTGLLDAAASNVYAVYPYSLDHVSANNTLYVFLPPDQTSVPGSFDPAAFVAVSKAEDDQLHFTNVCGGVVLNFCGDCQNYKYVQLETYSMQPLTGLFSYSESAGIGLASESYARLNPPEGGFQPGVDYFLCTQPTHLPDGFALFFVDKKNKVAAKYYSRAREIKRSTFGRINNCDANLEWTSDDLLAVDATPLSKQWQFAYSGKNCIVDINTSIPGYVILPYWGETSIHWSDIYKADAIRSDLVGRIFIYTDYMRNERMSQTFLIENGNVRVQPENNQIENNEVSQFVDMTPTSPAVSFSVDEYVVETDGDKYPLFFMKNDVKGQREQFCDIAYANHMSLPVVYIDGVGSPSDFDSNIVSGKVAIVNRGSLSLEEKAKNATAAGAIGILVVNNQSGIIYGNFGRSTTIPAAILEMRIKDHLAGVTELSWGKAALSDYPTSD